jgi:hypothetical protein
MKTFRTFLYEGTKEFTTDEARPLGDKLDVDWSKISIDEFVAGLAVESEHDDGTILDVVDSDLDLAKIVTAHLKEDPKYYTKLKQVEEEVPANSVSGGNVVGLTEPIVFARRKKVMKRA